MRVLLLGYYGHKNFGDDLLLKTCVNQLSPHLKQTTLAVSGLKSGEPYIRKLCPTIDQFEPIDSGLHFLRNYDRVIFGGGGTIFDYKEDHSLFSILRKRFSDARYYGRAKQSGTRFASIGLGIGPFTNSRAESVAMNRLKYHDLVYVRDQISFEFAEKHNLKKAVLGHDICFYEKSLLRKIGLEVESIPKCVTFIIRHYKYGGKNNACLSNMVSLADNLKNSGHKIRWMAFQPGYDDPAIEVIRDRKEEMWEWDPMSMSIENGYRHIAESCAVITARMHGTYIAGLLGRPSLSLSLHPKLKYASNCFENAKCVDPQDRMKIMSEATELIAESTKTQFPNDSVESDMKQMKKMVLRWIADGN